MNSRGPRTEPWGTPHKQVHEEERWLSHLTRKVSDKERDKEGDKYDLNQFKTDPWIPNREDRRVIKMSWSMVSNAAERSRRQRRDSFCEPMAFMR